MQTIGVFYLDTKGLDAGELGNQMESVFKYLIEINRNGEEFIHWIVLPSDHNKIEFWGDSTENLQPSKKLIKKLKASYEKVYEIRGYKNKDVKEFEIKVQEEDTQEK